MIQPKNLCHFIGRLGNDPETIHFENGGQITKFSIAVDESYKDKEGNKVQKTTWVNLDASGKLAEICEKYLSKGDKIAVCSMYKTRSYEKDGETKYTHGFQISSMEFCDTKGKNKQNQESNSTNNPDDYNDDNIPF